MKVICPGLTKTGTTSLAEALRILGYETYDFMEQVTYLFDDWHKLFFQGTKPDFKRMFTTVDAVTDTPASIFFEELFEQFPDAKVVLTVRDEEGWLKSVQDHLLLSSKLAVQIFVAKLFNPNMRRIFSLSAPINNATLGTNEAKCSYLQLKKYRRHTERVREVIPAKQLLIFNVKQGWKPLCDFLGHEIPNQVFPRKNVQGQAVKNYLWTIIESSKHKLMMLVMILVAFLGVLLYLFY